MTAIELFFFLVNCLCGMHMGRFLAQYMGAPGWVIGGALGFGLGVAFFCCIRMMLNFLYDRGVLRRMSEKDARETLLNSPPSGPL